MPFDLWRQDDHGHHFMVGRYPTLDAARHRLSELTSVQHKQIYRIATSDANPDQTEPA
jgi:hypothetical protein